MRKVIKMYDGGYDSHNTFPHDGEGGRECTGYGCDCDEKNYGYQTRGYGKSSSGNGVLWAFLIAIFIGLCFNELVGTVLLIGVIFYVLAR